MNTLWPAALRLLCGSTAAMILLGAWQAVFAPALPS